MMINLPLRRNERNGLLLILWVIGLLSAASCRLPFFHGKRETVISNSGFIQDAEAMHRAMEAELKVYDFRPGERIADIGASTGWFEGYLLIRFDSLTIYAQDISPYTKRNLRMVTEKYRTLRPGPDRNRVVAVRGRKKRSRLPSDYFDKVIVRKTFHHFGHPDAMLQDIRKIMKDDALLFVYEPCADTAFYDASDRAWIYDREELMRIFGRNAFVLTAEYEMIDGPGNAPPWWHFDPGHLYTYRLYVFRKTGP